MTAERYERLTKFVEQRAGDYFRTAISFTEDDWELLYRRSDLPRERVEKRGDEIVDRVRRQEPAREPDGPFGEFAAAIQLYENGVFAIIREGASEGVLISLESEAARSLASFIHECRRVLRSKE